MIIDPTLQAVDSALVEHEKKQKQRGYLGASGIGAECRRKLWYSFRWAKLKEKFSAKTLRIFNDGHRSEEAMAGMLQMIPTVELRTLNSKGKQYEFTAFGGHFSGHLDGFIKGLLHDPESIYIWEHKAVNEDKFKRFQDELGKKRRSRSALLAWDQIYYAQAQIYMGLSGCHNHYLTVSTPGVRDYASVVTEFREEHFRDYMEKARRVITDKEPPERISRDKNYFLCRFCAYQDICHEEKLPEANCRTCAHSTPDVDTGKWHCGFHGSDLSKDEQEKGCKKHLYIPPLLEDYGESESYSVENNSVLYKLFAGGNLVNGDSSVAFLSREIYNIVNSGENLSIIVKDKNIQSLKESFDATVVE